MDLVQEVFVRMLRYRESFRGEGGGFTTWMFTLARRVYLDHAKRADRHDHRNVSEIQEPSSSEPDLSENLERRESLATLRRALLALPEEKREVLLLRRFHLKNFNEIGEILGCSAGAARVRAHRAIRELRRIYENLVGEANP
jgi:RNA polymerase sigma-70 factor (ECF subfamily)